MSVKIMTDSTSDISDELARELDIEVVPSYIRFGNNIYRDGMDISRYDFYRMLEEYPVAPITYEASPKDFTEVYANFRTNYEGILSIHISSKISRMYQSALKGSKKVKSGFPIEVIDSRLASVGLGLIVVNAARMAKAGESLEEISNETKKSIRKIAMLGLFDTLKYAAIGSRVTKQVIELSGVFNIKPLLTFRDGEVVVEGLVRTYADGIDRLLKFAKSNLAAEEISISYSTDYNSVNVLKRQLTSFIPEARIVVEQMSAALGAHCGPNAVFIAIRKA